MATTAKFEINGVVDTGRSVLENINTLANASGVFVTWDPNSGTWSVIKNDVGTPVMNFNDSNIVGNINVSGSGINDMYNAVTIEFPHQDLRDTRDYIDLEIPQSERFAQELDNRLEIKLECINNPVQAQLIAARELKQSRVDKVIEFSTSYLGNGLSAGDLISVTSSMYGYTNKVFRIITIQEEDTDESGIIIRITALEYDADVYSTAGLVRKERNKKTGITPKAANEVIFAEEGNGAMLDLSAGLLLGLPALLNLLMNGLTRQEAGIGLTPLVDVFVTGFLTLEPHTTEPLKRVDLGFSFVLPYTGLYKTKWFINWGGSGAPGPDGVLKQSQLIIRINGVDRNFVGGAETGDEHVQLYEDHFLETIWFGEEGEVAEMVFGYGHDWGPGKPAWQSGNIAVVLINGETNFVER
jgi:hypothetical protein